MIENIIRITTHDTEKVYEFPGKDNPPLWSATLSLTPINQSGRLSSYQYDVRKKTVVIELATLLEHGLKPDRPSEEETEKAETASETVEDLLIRLLDMVGVYPVE